VCVGGAIPYHFGYRSIIGYLIDLPAHTTAICLWYVFWVLGFGPALLFDNPIAVSSSPPQRPVQHHAPAATVHHTVLIPNIQLATSSTPYIPRVSAPSPLLPRGHGASRQGANFVATATATRYRLSFSALYHAGRHAPPSSAPDSSLAARTHLRYAQTNAQPGRRAEEEALHFTRGQW